MKITKLPVAIAYGQIDVFAIEVNRFVGLGNTEIEIRMRALEASPSEVKTTELARR